MFKIDAADYMMSICGNDALRELSSPGKSGSVFFLSQDDRFMIKTLRKSEVKVRLYMLGPYLFTFPFHFLKPLLNSHDSNSDVYRFCYGCFPIIIIMLGHMRIH